MRELSFAQRAENLQRTRLVPGFEIALDSVDEIDRLISDTAKRLGVTETAVIEFVRKHYPTRIC